MKLQNLSASFFINYGNMEYEIPKGIIEVNNEFGAYILKKAELRGFKVLAQDSEKKTEVKVLSVEKEFAPEEEEIKPEPVETKEVVNKK